MMGLKESIVSLWKYVTWNILHLLFFMIFTCKEFFISPDYLFMWATLQICKLDFQTKC